VSNLSGKTFHSTLYTYILNSSPYPLLQFYRLQCVYLHHHQNRFILTPDFPPLGLASAEIIHIYVLYICICVYIYISVCVCINTNAFYKGHAERVCMYVSVCTTILNKWADAVRRRSNSYSVLLINIMSFIHIFFFFFCIKVTLKRILERRFIVQQPLCSRVIWRRQRRIALAIIIYTRICMSYSKKIIKNKFQ
jgi:hypothetical protein